jgi:Flp pilus assembly protein TadG
MRITSQKRARGSKGIALLLTGVMITGAMMTVGLAIDVGMMYAVKTKLSAAADAAALAGARALGRAGSGGPTALATASAYFDSNMPQGYMLSTNISVTPSGPIASGHVQTIKVDAQADLPMLFSRFLKGTQTIKVSATSSRQDVNLVLVLDRSGSMNVVVNGTTACAKMVSAAQDFTTQFVDGRDQLGLVVFGGSYSLAYPISSTFKSGASINNVIGSIACGGNTGSAQAIYEAHKMLTTLNQPGALNVIVFFTDGQPNGLTASWPIAKLATPVYPNSTGMNTGAVGSTVVQPWFLGYAASNCNGGADVAGFIARNGEQQHGVRAALAPSISAEGALVSASNCAFTGNENNVHQDVAYIPATDFYGNKTTGYWDNVSATSTHAAAQKLLIPTGPYANQVMLDHYAPGTCGLNVCGLFNNNIDLASMNAAEDAALAARNDVNIPITIFSIGLGGAADVFPGDFLDHVANTQSSDLYDSARPSGKYVFVTGAGQLGAAFLEVASYVQRLTN